MKIKCFTISLIIYFAVFATHAQDDDQSTIDAQRPTLTESYSIILPNMIQFESGLDYFTDSNTVSYGTFVRGSVTKRVELRAFTDYQNTHTIGAKFVVLEPENSVSKIGASFLYNRNLNNDSDDYRIALTKTFQSFFITYNFGYNTGIYNIALLGIPLANQFTYFVEYYNDSETNRVHTGFTWIPQRDIQLDINGGWMGDDKAYVGLGVSFRLR
jgi:hypothetical protein